jgi:ubiquinone/menaquinone biosynthesis C-methylase UbiE
MNQSDKPIGQSELSVSKNSTFFLNELDAYSAGVEHLDTYRFIREAIDEAIAGSGSLLDIGNGGVFDYNTSLAKRIVAVDLFLDSLPKDYRCPENVTLRKGDALALPEADQSHDAALMVMLLHHLVARTVRQSLLNIDQALREAWRVLAPGGSLIIVESCVPGWFYAMERAAFPVASAIIGRTMAHPPTLQFPPQLIAGAIRRVTGMEPVIEKVRQGRWVLQYGRKWPSALTPIGVWRFITRRPKL